MTASVQVAMRDDEGGLIPASPQRWFSEAEAADLEVLDQARGPVLDIGCGPGRHVAELARRGVPALGIDITEPMLHFARMRGAAVLQRSVFARIPGAGRWASALLLDGNIGIGGDPRTLLDRTRALLSADGIVLVELAAPGICSMAKRVRLELDGRLGPTFRWSTLTTDDLQSVAAACGFVTAQSWRVGTRHFARLEPAVGR